MAVVFKPVGFNSLPFNSLQPNAAALTVYFTQLLSENLHTTDARTMRVLAVMLDAVHADNQFFQVHNWAILMNEFIETYTEPGIAQFRILQESVHLTTSVLGAFSVFLQDNIHFRNLIQEFPEVFVEQARDYFDLDIDEDELREYFRMSMESLLDNRNPTQPGVSN